MIGRLLAAMVRGAGVALALAVAAAAFGQQAPGAGGSSPWADLDPPLRAKVDAAVARFLQPPKVDDRSANNLGWDCLAALGLFRAGMPAAKARVESIAQALAEQVVIDPVSKKAVGWRAALSSPQCKNGGYDAFNDGTCNDPDATYGFQTGLGIACLAQASSVAGRPDWLRLAGEAMDRWRDHRLPGSVCDGCVYFTFSDSDYDAGRYVRNMNVFVAFGAAQLGAVRGDRDLLELAGKAARSDVAERDAGNRGYLGRLDPQWKARAGERDRIENHSAAVAVLALDIGRIVPAGEAFVQHGTRVWRDWAACQSDLCRNAGCRYWGGDAQTCQSTLTAAHCAFRRADPLAAAQCRVYIEKVQWLPSFALWALTLGASATR